MTITLTVDELMETYKQLKYQKKNILAHMQREKAIAITIRHAVDSVFLISFPDFWRIKRNEKIFFFFRRLWSMFDV